MLPLIFLLIPTLNSQVALAILFWKQTLPRNTPNIGGKKKKIAERKIIIKGME